MKRLSSLLFALLCLASAEAQKPLPVVVSTLGKASTERTEIILPQVKGFNCYKADFHIHTSYSDGQVTPAGRVDEAWYDGLDILAITDHYENHSGVKKFLKVTAPYNEDGQPTPYKATAKENEVKIDFNAIHAEAERRNAKKGYNLLLVKGCEMARSKEKLGHYNALFVEDLNTIYNFDLKEAFKNVKRQGGIVIHNHPGNVEKYETEWHAECRKEGLIDGVEVANGYRYYPQMVRRCVDEKLTMFGNTDAHGLNSHRFATTGVFRTMTFVLAKDCTEKAIKNAIKKRRTIVYSGGCLIGEEAWLSEFANAAIDCRLAKVNEKKGSRTFHITNNSSIAFHLRKGRTIYELEPFKSLSVNFGKHKESGKYRAPKFTVENMWCVDHKHPVLELDIDKR